MSDTAPSAAFAPKSSGTWIVGGMIGLAVFLALFAVWYQRSQTRRCLSFYGSEAARRLQEAPRVELWELAQGGTSGAPVPTSRTDITAARGLVHLRRGLVEDANFAWDRPPSGPSAPTLALAFFDAVDDPDPATILLVAIDDAGGSLAVAGRSGAVALGRIAAGLRKWLGDVAVERPKAVRGDAAVGN